MSHIETTQDPAALFSEQLFNGVERVNDESPQVALQRLVADRLRYKAPSAEAV